MRLDLLEGAARPAGSCGLTYYKVLADLLVGAGLVEDLGVCFASPLLLHHAGHILKVGPSFFLPECPKKMKIGMARETDFLEFVLHKLTLKRPEQKIRFFHFVFAFYSRKY